MLGSLHCVGMCTPLQLALRRWLGLGPMALILYHLGRVGTYAVLGGLAGLFSSFLLAYTPLQRGVGFASVAVLGLLALGQLTGLRAFRLRAPAALQLPLQRMIARLQRTGNSAGVVFLLGSANGLLPCGLVYLALVGTLAIPGAGGGGLYMGAFGLGTLPALLLSQWALRRLAAPRFPLALISLALAGLLLYRTLHLPTSPVEAAQCAPPAEDGTLLLP